MAKEKKILSYFIGWLLLAFIICFIGVSNVFAATYYLDYTYVQVYYDNNGSSVSTVGQTWNESLQSYVSNKITTAAGSYGAGIAFNSPIPILSNHNYSISIYFPERNNIALSSKDKIAIGNSADSASYNYTNDQYWVTQNYSNVSNNSIISYNFTANGPATYIFIPWTTISTTTQDYNITQIIIEDLGSEGVSESTINNSINNQTTIIQNNIANMQDNITSSIQETEDNINSNIDDMEEAIIDSNKETQEVIKDQFNTCRDSYNLISSSSFTIGDIYAYYELEENTPYILSIKLKDGGTTGTYNIGFKDDYNTTQGNYRWLLSNGSYNISTTGSDGFYYINNYISSSYMKYVIIYPRTDTTISELFSNYDIQLVKGNTYQTYEPYGEQVCTNKLDEANETSKGIWATIKELPSMFLDMLKGLIIPDNFDFIYEFTDVLSSKLGFIGSIPLQFIEYILSLPNKVFEPVTTISFPSIEIFGVKFWNDMEVDITEGLSWISSFKYLTDLGCVIIMINTLHKWYENFTGGGN